MAAPSHHPTADHQLVPSEDDQPAKDFVESCTYADREDAEEAFIKAKDRLLNPSLWHSLAGTFSARFQPTDASGKPLQRGIRTGDLLRIHVPGPAGAADDWVQVEALAYDDFPDENREVIALRVRPTADPEKPGDETAHFFGPDATSSFVIERRNTEVAAAYHGRHEMPNREGDTLLRKTRDVVTAIAGLLGFSDLQWTALLKGLLPEPASDANRE